MPRSFLETEHPALIVGQDCILRAGSQPALAACVRAVPGGLPTRRRIQSCPTSSAGFPVRRMLSGIRHECLRHGAHSIRSATNPITAISAHSTTNQFPYRVYGVRSEMYVNPV